MGLKSKFWFIYMSILMIGNLSLKYPDAASVSFACAVIIGFWVCVSMAITAYANNLTWK